jgi:Flp pilus assembly protein TadB
VVLAAAATAGGCVLAGWLAALLWRAPAERRARGELARLQGLVELHASAAQRASGEARMQYVRAQVEEADRRQAQLRAHVAEDEAEQLRTLAALWEATPCVLCRLPPPLCPHGAEERRDWIRQRGFP